MDNSEAKIIVQESERTAPSETRVCDKHDRRYESRNLFGRYWTPCPQCREEREIEEKARAERTRKQEAHDELLRRLATAAIPPRFAEKSFSDYVATTDEQKRALSVAKAYAENFDAVRRDGTCLVFCGRAGTGKTHLSAAIATAACEAGYTALFTSVLRATRAVKDTYRKDSDILEREAILMFTKPDLLVIDEVGVQFGSDAEKLILFEIINTRYEYIMPTIVISNLAREGLEEYLGERAFDRMREGSGKLVVFDWESHRRRAA